MRQLFDNNPKQPPSIDSRSYLRFDGIRARIQTLIYDEVDRFGIEQLLKSRGARILKTELEFSELEEHITINSDADVVILSPPPGSFSEGNLASLINEIGQNAPESRVLIITGIKQQVEALLALGESISAASGVNLRSDRIDANSLLQDVRVLALGETVDPEYGQTELGGSLSRAYQLIPNLTARESEILGHLAQGSSNKQIAGILKLSLRTVNNHVGMVFLKLGVNSNPDVNARVTAALAYCISTSIMIGTPESDALSTGDAAAASETNFRVTAATLNTDSQGS
jgi:DNA-binding NarL/FixJ family response regulator